MIMERKEAIEVIKKNWPDSSFTMLREALESLIPELVESEDERIRKHLIGVVELYYGNTDEQEKKDCLAWLEKQGEQKPAWSEEDEQMLNHVIIDIESLKEQVYCRTLCDEEIDWLKSLRPQNEWKPSDEQMDALETAVSSLQSTSLESLYNELKKL